MEYYTYLPVYSAAGTSMVMRLFPLIHSIPTLHITAKSQSNTFCQGCPSYSQMVCTRPCKDSHLNKPLQTLLKIHAS